MRLKFSDAARLTAVIALAFFISASLPASAQPSAQFAACQKTAKTQLALDTCASRELALRNAQMQSVYSTILSHFARQSSALAKVRAMQSGWLAYASAYLDALYPAPNKEAEYGSIYPMASAMARAALVERHIQDLNGLLQTNH